MHLPLRPAFPLPTSSTRMARLSLGRRSVTTTTHATTSTTCSPCTTRRSHPVHQSSSATSVRSLRSWSIRMTLPPSEDDKSHTPKFDLTSFACTPVHDGSKIPSRRPSINSPFTHGFIHGAAPDESTPLRFPGESARHERSASVRNHTDTHSHSHNRVHTMACPGRSGASNDLHGRVHGRL